MKKFRFPLETLLKVREQRVKMFQKKLMEKEKESLELHQNYLHVKQAISLSEREIKNKRIEGDLLYDAQRDRYLKFLQKQANDIRAAVIEKKKEQQECQKRATKVLQERKIVEKIRKTKYAAWNVENEKEEYKERLFFASFKR
jgi:hypothetical protein